MNYFQRKRFMKAAWLMHFTAAGPVPRRRRPDEVITDVELNAMCLLRADVEPVMSPHPLCDCGHSAEVHGWVGVHIRSECAECSCLRYQPWVAETPTPPPDTEPDAVPANLALLLGYHPVD